MLFSDVLFSLPPPVPLSPPVVVFIDRAGKVATPERNLAGKHSSHLVYLSLLSRTKLASARNFSAQTRGGTK